MRQEKSLRVQEAGNMFHTKQEAIDFIYESYLKAQPYLNYNDPDGKKEIPHGQKIF